MANLNDTTPAKRYEAARSLFVSKHLNVRKLPNGALYAQNGELGVVFNPITGKWHKDINLNERGHWEFSLFDKLGVKY